MGKEKKPSTSTEADRVLRNEYKKLKAENKHLRRELEKNIKKSASPKLEDFSNPDTSEKCSFCKNGNITINDLGFKKFISCSNGCKEARKILKND